ncbi:MAG: hypothetical protein Q8M83_05130 [bacterium]|nr:hypothetical protein [bacterium]
MKFSKRILFYLVAFLIIFSVFKIIEAVSAGSLNPTAAPAATMRSLEDVYNRMAGAYDASGETANSNGTVLQQLKDIKTRMGME